MPAERRGAIRIASAGLCALVACTPPIAAAAGEVADDAPPPEAQHFALDFGLAGDFYVGVAEAPRGDAVRDPRAVGGNLLFAMRVLGGRSCLCPETAIGSARSSSPPSASNSTRSLGRRNPSSTRTTGKFRSTPIRTGGE